MSQASMPCLPQDFLVRITMLSDWHVGSGGGQPGHIDRLVVRDADGLPYVPAKTLRGIWRDACERLAFGLDDGRTGPWCRLVDFIFGSQPALGEQDPSARHAQPEAPPLSSALLVRPARIPGALRNALLAQPAVCAAVTFVKPGVSIDPATGCARDEYLRFEEMARQGTILEAACTLAPIEDELLRQAASALLVGALALIERLGGKRRRGAGRCRAEVAGSGAITPQQAADWLAAHAVPPSWPQTDLWGRLPPLSSDLAPTPPTASGRWVDLEFTVALRSPLALLYRTLGNVVETLDYVPGTYLLPHVTRALLKLGYDPRPAIGCGDLRVLPALLEVAGQRGRPVPLAWYAPKASGAAASKIVNRLIGSHAPATQLKQLRGKYVSVTQSHAVIQDVPKASYTHNTVFDRLQRPSQEVGGLYTYEAIAPLDEGFGQVPRPVRLRGVLRLREDMAAALANRQAHWWEALNGTVCLGRSKKDDYGEVTLTFSSPQSAASSHAAMPGNVPARQPVTVYLESDVLLRDASLRPAASEELLRGELERRLGVKLDSVQAEGDGVDDGTAAFVRVRRLDTWHVGWGLPRPSLVALQAGSCLRFVAQAEIQAETLAQVMAAGIGERTAEGYGCVSFNDPLLESAHYMRALEPAHAVADSAPPQDPAAQGNTIALVPPDDPGHALARTIEREHWRQEIYRAALARAANSEFRERELGWQVRQGKPDMSQLGGFRNQLALLRRPADRQQVLSWLSHLEQNPRRQAKWPESALRLVRKILDDHTKVWELLGLLDPETLTTQGQQTLREELWPLAVRALFDACIRAYKRDLESMATSGREATSHGT